MTESCNLLIGIGRKYLDPGSIFQVSNIPIVSILRSREHPLSNRGCPLFDDHLSRVETLFWWARYASKPGEFVQIKQ